MYWKRSRLNKKQWKVISQYKNENISNFLRYPMMFLFDVAEKDFRFIISIVWWQGYPKHDKYLKIIGYILWYRFKSILQTCDWWIVQIYKKMDKHNSQIRYGMTLQFNVNLSIMGWEHGGIRQIAHESGLWWEKSIVEILIHPSVWTNLSYSTIFLAAVILVDNQMFSSIANIICYTSYSSYVSLKLKVIVLLEYLSLKAIHT